jgi:hypothetical protein
MLDFAASQQTYMVVGRNRPVVVKFSDSFYCAIGLFRSKTVSA